MLSEILVYFTHAAVVVFGLLVLLWAVSVAVKDASLIDIYWGFGFLVVAAVCLYLANPNTNYLILLIWAVGFFFETVGDWQLMTFLKKHKDYNGPKENKPVLDTGLWRYTRHPNYFGNFCMWWGIWLVACAAPWGWVTIFGPIIMTILLVKVSGKGLLEKDMGRRENYKKYIEKTSGFFPMPPKKQA